MLNTTYNANGADEKPEIEFFFNVPLSIGLLNSAVFQSIQVLRLQRNRRELQLRRYFHSVR